MSKYYDEQYDYNGTKRSEVDYNAQVAARMGDEKKEREEFQKRLDESNKILLEVPNDLNEGEKVVWNEFANLLIAGSNKIKTQADKEMLRQLVYFKALRDTAWQEWNKNPELHIKVITGVDRDGKTPKITIKENQHYGIFTDSNKQIERILDDLGLSFKVRR